MRQRCARRRARLALRGRGASRTAATDVQQMAGKTEDARITGMANGQLEDELVQGLVGQQLGQDGFQTYCEALGREQRHFSKPKREKNGPTSSSLTP